ncbi:MAG: hemerythrin domain-containing protein [Gammaproteobacteria bacterium]|nr:hemerythrin domain-containing protein [Gammaproteobacteria bacterium]
MIPIEEFKNENKEIRDLCDILSVSIDQYSLRKNNVVCELLERFADRVNQHLMHEDRSVYRDLLQQHTHEADVLADHFLGNTQELKRIFKEYTHGWCSTPHAEGQHIKYVEESRHMFRLVCERLTFEEEKIFPYFEKTK